MIKTLLALIAILPTLPAIAQPISPPRKTNTILIKGITTDSILYKLVNAGYEIKSQVANSIITEFKNIDETTRIKLTILVKDSGAYLTARASSVAIAFAFKLGSTDEANFQVEKSGSKNSALRTAWHEMWTVGKLLGNNREYLVVKKL